MQCKRKHEGLKSIKAPFLTDVKSSKRIWIGDLSHLYFICKVTV